MPLKIRKSEYLADEVARMEKLKDNAEISERVSRFISSEIHALKPHRSDGKPRNEYMLYVWKSQPNQIGIGVYAPVVAGIPDDIEPQEIISDLTPEEYDAVLFYRNEIASMLSAEGFDYQIANEGVTPATNSFGRRPYATMDIFYGDEEMQDMTTKTMILMGIKAPFDDYEVSGDVAADNIRDIWLGIQDEIDMIVLESKHHSEGMRIQSLLEELAKIIE